MISAPNQLTETPDEARDQAIDDILGAMRLSGGVFIDVELRGRWSVISEFFADQCELFFPVTGSLIGYHFVRAGHFWIEVAGQAPQLVEPGAMILIPRNDPHLLFNDDVPTVSSQSALNIPEDRTTVTMRVGEDEDGKEPVQLYCGFMSASDVDNPLLERLPRLLVIEPGSALQKEWLASSLRFATEAMAAGQPAEVGKLAELMFRETLRGYLKRIASEQPAWLSGLRDPVVARALAVIHRRFAEELDVAGIAREVGVSRSALGDRFTALMGEPPMHYCARWRMRVAANMLREREENTASIAYAVGFNSEAAFNRAFKREYGEPPAAWRKRKLEQLALGKPFGTSIGQLI